jgi:hypothetical protein
MLISLKKDCRKFSHDWGKIPLFFVEVYFIMMSFSLKNSDIMRGMNIAVAVAIAPIMVVRTMSIDGVR